MKPMIPAMNACFVTTATPSGFTRLIMIDSAPLQADEEKEKKKRNCST